MSDDDALAKNDLEKVIAYCNSQGAQVGPFLKEEFNDVSYGSVDYRQGRISARGTPDDGKVCYFSMQTGKPAFGGLRDDPCYDFEEIEGVAHLRAPAAGGKTALVNASDGVYTGKAYDTIERGCPEPLGGKGEVFHVRDGGLEGYLLNGKLCGGENGMAHSTRVIQEGDEIYLEQTTEEGAMRIVDIETGEILYGDEPKCTGIKFRTIGEELCAEKTYGKGENAVVGLRAKDGENIYQGLVDTVEIGEWFECPGVGILARAYNKDRWLVIVNRNGHPHFTGESPVASEAFDGKLEDGTLAKDGRHYINGKLFMKFIVEKPGLEHPEPQIVYRDSKSRNRFGTPHDEEVTDKPNRITVEYFERNMAGTQTKFKRTGILFKRSTTKKMFWMSEENISMFGGDHWDDLETIYWQYDLEGRLTELPFVFKRFKDTGMGETIMDFVGKAYFEKKEGNIPTHHDEIRNFWVVPYEIEGEARYALVLEAWDDAGYIKGFGRAIKGLLKGKGRRPSNFYLMDGTKFDSEEALKQHFGLDESSNFLTMDDFENARILSSGTRDTREIIIGEGEDEGEDRSVNAMIERGELPGGPEAPAEGAPETITGETLEDTLQQTGEAAFGEDAGTDEQPPAQDDGSSEPDNGTTSWLHEEGAGEGGEGQES